MDNSQQEDAQEPEEQSNPQERVPDPVEPVAINPTVLEESEGEVKQETP